MTATRQPVTVELLRRMVDDPRVFRQHLWIDTGDRDRPLAEVLTEQQRRDFAAMDEAWKAAAGVPGANPRHRMFWIERCRGGSKTTDQAILLAWFLTFARRPRRAVAAAVDADQAALLRRQIEVLCELNPWLGQALDCRRSTVTNSRMGSTLEILSADAPSSYGILVDAITIDELSHWRSDQLWTSLASAAAKRPNCVLTCLMNAGWRSSWQHDLRAKIAADPDWYFSAETEPPAYIPARTVEQQKRLLLPSEYQRLWGGIWTEGEDAAISEEDLQRAITLPGPHTYPLPGHLYGAGLDLGIRHDRCALVIFAVQSGSGRINVVLCRSWKAPPGGTVDLRVVRNEVYWISRQFALRCIAFDPYEAVLLAQELGGLGIPMLEVPFRGQNLDHMARDLVSIFRDGRIALYDDPELIEDLRSLRVEERAWGVRLGAPRDAKGHADLAFALAVGLPPAWNTAMSPPMEPEPEPSTVRVPLEGGGFIGVRSDQFETVDDMRAFADMVDARRGMIGGGIPTEGIPTMGNFFGL